MRLLSTSLILLLSSLSWAGVRFDAAGDYFTRTTSLPDSVNWTACGWARRQVDTNAFAAICQLSAAVGYNDYTTANDGDNVEVDTSVNSSASIATVANGLWFGWCMTGSGSGAGQLVGDYLLPGQTTFTTQSTTGQDMTETEIFLGTFNNASADPWNGDIAYVKIWEAVLTAGERLNELKHIRPMRTQNLSMWTPIYTSISITDFSGNGRSWTSNGTLTSSDAPPVGW